jgi:hypothetical protein
MDGLRVVVPNLLEAVLHELPVGGLKLASSCAMRTAGEIPGNLIPTDRDKRSSAGAGSRLAPVWLLGRTRGQPRAYQFFLWKKFAVGRTAIAYRGPTGSPGEARSESAMGYRFTECAPTPPCAFDLGDRRSNWIM